MVELRREESEFGIRFLREADGLEKEINLYNEPILETDGNLQVIIVSESGPDFMLADQETRERLLNRMLEQDREKSPGDVYKEDWREAVVRQNDKHDPYNPRNLVFVVSTSYRAQQLREIKKRSFEEADVFGERFNSIEGVIVTSDERVIYGIRGGDFKKGIMHVLPTGSIPPNDQGHTIFEAFYGELREELGIERDEISGVKWIADQTDPNITVGRHYIVVGETKFTSSELMSMHSAAFRVYQSAKDDGVSEKEAKLLIAEKGHKMVDAWEHSKLTPLTPKDIADGVLTGQITYDGNTYKLLQNGRDILVAYDEHMKK